MRKWRATFLTSILLLINDAAFGQILHRAGGMESFLLPDLRCVSPSAKRHHQLMGASYTPQEPSETKWEFSHRLQAGWEYDSNIYEGPGATRIASGSTRFLIHTGGNHRHNQWRFHYNYATALQTYSGHRDENKLTHDFDGQFAARLRPWLHLSSKASATLKLYLENPLDYGTTSGSVLASVSLPRKILMDFVVETGQLDYAESDTFDFTFRGFALAVRQPLSPNNALETTINRRYLRYQLVPFDRRDELTTLRVALTLGRKIVTQLALEAQINRSDRTVYDFARVRLIGLLGLRPAPRWLLRAAGMFQYKRYREKLRFISDLDPEREQSNFLVTDLSRDLSDEISLLTRVAFYDNESVVRSRFYRKVLYFAGLELRL
jgi:hypothetical protein